MIIHRLIAQHLRHRDDADFYRLQAQDAIRWMGRNGLVLPARAAVLDLGCGQGIFGAEFLKRDCQVTFADEINTLLPVLSGSKFCPVNLDRDDLTALGTFDLVICSNVFEHLSKPRRFITSVGTLLRSCGRLYLSWTNWLSPWGGHEFSPFHYLGAARGHLLYDKVCRRPRVHTPHQNLFPTYIGTTLNLLRQQPDLRVLRVAPRYYPELAFLARIPLVREFLTWNCAVWVAKQPIGTVVDRLAVSA